MHAVRMMLLFVVLVFLLGADSGGTDANAAIGILREFGFPIFVSLWFMWRVEKRMDKFTDAVQNLLTIVTIVAKTVDGLAGASGPTRTSTHQPESKVG